MEFRKTVKPCFVAVYDHDETTPQRRDAEEICHGLLAANYEAELRPNGLSPDVTCRKCGEPLLSLHSEQAPNPLSGLFCNLLCAASYGIAAAHQLRTAKEEA